MNSSSRPFGLIAVFGIRGSKLHRDQVKKGQAWVAVSSALTEGKMVRKQCRRRSLQEVVEEVARLLCQREENDSCCLRSKSRYSRSRYRTRLALTRTTDVSIIVQTQTAPSPMQDKGHLRSRVIMSFEILYRFYRARHHSPCIAT